MDDLDFGKLISLIRTDLGYDDSKDTIIYARPGLPSIVIKNKREWRAALVEMHTLGAERFSLSSESGQASDA